MIGPIPFLNCGWKFLEVFWFLELVGKVYFLAYGSPISIMCNDSIGELSWPCSSRCTINKSNYKTKHFPLL